MGDPSPNDGEAGAGTTTDTLRRAIGLHRAGRLREAMELYRAILAGEPGHPEALNLGGVAASQLGEVDAGLSMLRTAVALAPGNAKAHNNLGIVLQDRGDFEDAAAAFQRAIDIDDEDDDLYVNLGNALKALNRNDDAVAAYRRATEIAPGDGEAHGTLGAMLVEVGRLEEADAACRRALAINPDDADAHINLGNVLKAQGRPEAAVVTYRRALEIKPDDARIHNNLGGALRDLGNLEAAVLAYERALAIDPNMVGTLSNLGNVLKDLGRLDEAVAAHRRALAINPKHVEVLSNLGNALIDHGKLDEAIACFQRALEIASDNATVHYNLGTAYLENGKPDEAIEWCQRAIKIDPDHAEVHWNQALALLLAGRLTEGWKEYEWRWDTKDFPSQRRNFPQPLWDGDALHGQTILLHTEQGMGDAIQFVRYVPRVAEFGGRVVVECQEELERLFESVPDIDQLVVKGKALPQFGVHAPLLSLPGIFGTELESIPNAVPYLAPPKDSRVDLGRDGNLNVGIVWAGNPAHQNDRTRSIDLGEFEPLLGTPGCRFFSLQVGERSGDIERLGLGGRLTDLGARLSDFGATASAMAELDLVISVDTSVVHLAGALGTPVWTLLSGAPDWRWLLDRDDSPWYPTMRLFRQTQRGDWPEVLRRVADSLRAMAKIP